MLDGQGRAGLHQAVLRRDDERLLGPAATRSAALPGGAQEGSRARPRRTVNDLPDDAGRLIGREAELEQLIAPSAPGSVSIVTVDGTAGVGKTALVVRAARELSARYPDGCSVRGCARAQQAAAVIAGAGAAATAAIARRSQG
ncbi:hypothetical protein [Streptomyces sp. NPDC001530]|uniref:hypothetical protein n=1 Tax=Streptomyces sp. NPDC001530 TaxID=3364582 RepID=UPI0036AC4059